MDIETYISLSVMALLFSGGAIAAAALLIPTISKGYSQCNPRNIALGLIIAGAFALQIVAICVACGAA